MSVVGSNPIEVTTMQVPSDVRRALRSQLGTRTNRKNGVKSHGHKKPRTRLAELIRRWWDDGCPDISRKK